MLGHEERLAILLLLAVASTVIVSHLVLDAVGKRPFVSPYSEQSVDGDLVVVSGTIDSLSPTRTSGHLVIIIDNLPVFIPNQIAAGLDVHTGTNLSVIGTVQTYRGRREIVVSSASDIEVER